MYIQASEIEALPVWDQRREWLHWREIPAFLKYFFNFTVCDVTVYKWVTHGRISHTDKTRYYLNSRLLFHRRYVKKQDLVAFIFRM